jgi:hypothetical protein
LLVTRNVHQEGGKHPTECAGDAETEFEVQVAPDRRNAMQVLVANDSDGQDRQYEPAKGQTMVPNLGGNDEGRESGEG